MDIDLYIDSVYFGFFPIEEIEERFEEYRESAEEYLDELNDDEVIVYAIFKYEKDSEKILYANLMTVRLTYDEYAEICRSDNEYRRYFFVRKGNTSNYED